MKQSIQERATLATHKMACFAKKTLSERIKILPGHTFAAMCGFYVIDNVVDG
jgi:hypothetical protein